MTFETYARGWLSDRRNMRLARSRFTGRSLETVFPEIGAIKLNKLPPIALENLLAKLRKRTHRANPSRKRQYKNI